MMMVMMMMVMVVVVVLQMQRSRKRMSGLALRRNSSEKRKTMRRWTRMHGYLTALCRIGIEVKGAG